jgi:methylenetetrahydrofolate reductase (NADPH)
MSLIRIGEDLHCHIPSVQKSAKRWYCGDALDKVAGELHLTKLVQRQAAAGASYIDVNVDDYLIDADIGREGALEIMEFIFLLIERHGRHTPICIDSSDPGILEWGLDRYYQLHGGHVRPPLMNSVAATRLEPLQLRKKRPFSVVGMLLESAFESTGFTDIAEPDTYYKTARYIFDKAIDAGFAPDEVYFDPAVGPLGADMVGYTRRTFEGIRMIRADRDMKDVHITIGLSNCSEGLPRRLGVNRAYLRVAMEYGVDSAICNAGRVTGKDLVDPWILKLIKKVVTSESMDTLGTLVDFAQGHPRTSEPTPRQPLRNAFKETLQNTKDPVYILEMAPSEHNLDALYEMAEGARDTDLAISITDTPSGGRSPGSEVIGMEVARITGRQPIVNLSCKADDRDGLMRRALGAYNQGLQNLFAVTGDYSFDGRPSFDLDAVTLLMALDGLRRGLDFPSLMPRSGEPLSDLFVGAAVSPFKYMEPDLWGQYLKLCKKRRAGADYFITQVGWDVKKFQELKLYMNRSGMADVPVLGSVFVMRMRLVSTLFRARVAGMVIPDDLNGRYLGRLRSKKERRRIRKMSFVELMDWQNRMSRRDAALLADILVRGLGYRGVDLAGVSDVAEALEIREMIRELEGRDWRENYEEYREGNDERERRFAPDDAYYLFPDGEGELLADGAIQAADRSGYPRTSGLMKWAHQSFFEPGTSGHDLLNWAVARPDGSRLERLATNFEEVTKSRSLGCEMCGDCRIPDLQFLCPEPTSGCAKRLTNGPCGGADESGNCEVVPERRCYWGEVIERALKAGEFDTLGAFQLPKDPRLAHTSSWRNEVLGLCPKPLKLDTSDWTLPE